MTQAELQQDVLRFVGRFNELIRQAMDPLEHSENATIRSRAINNHVIYTSSALDIALGATPTANLLDMVAFVELSARAARRYWVPKVYGNAGRPLLRAFDRSSEDVWAVAAKVLDQNQQKILANVIEKWIQKNPNQVAVEGVRLSGFSYAAGEAALASQVGGLMSGIKQGLAAADEAKMLAERALFYGERLPFLVRAHAKAGAREVTGELLQMLGQLERSIEPKVTTVLAKFESELLSRLKGWAIYAAIGAAFFLLFFFLLSIASRLIAEYLARRWIRIKPTAAEDIERGRRAA